jgi:hypothetical protein
MLTIKKGNLLTAGWDFAAHCANTECVMGAGVALALKNKWPEVYQADKDCTFSREEKYGKYSRADLPNGKAVYNLYAQVGIGNNGNPLNRNIRYDLLFDSLYLASEDAQIIMEMENKDRVMMGLPWLGTGLSGGSKEIVHAIVREISLLFENIDYTIWEL